MSKDIRSYFSVLSSKSKTTPSKPLVNEKRKSRAIVLSSDEDIIPETPVKQKKQDTFKKRKVHVLSSDSEDEFQAAKKAKDKVTESKKTLKLVNASDIFGSEPVKQAKVPERPKATSDVKDGKVEVGKTKRKKKGQKVLEKEKFEDKKFEETLLDLDDDFLSVNMDQLDESIKVAEKEFEKDGMNTNVEEVKIQTSKENDMDVSTSNTNGFNDNSTKTPMADSNVDSSFNQELDVLNVDKRPKSKRKLEDYDPEDDMNRHEKRRQSAILYQKYLNRSGPAHHGSKDIPKGKPDCLKNVCFIRTGVLDSLDNDEFETLIKDHGGRTVHSVSKKVNYVVAGEDPGPAKIEKAKGYGIRVISEDELLDLIRTKSGLPVKKVADDDTSNNHINGLSKDKTPQNRNGEEKISNNHIEPFTNNINGLNKSDSKTKVNLNNINGGENLSSKSSVVSDFENSSSSSKYFNKDKTSSNAKICPQSKTEPARDVSKTETFLPWTEKYKPTNVKSIIGQQGDKSNMKRLMTWLQNWFKNHSGKNKPKLSKPSQWAKSDDGGYYKAALLSGSPGIGKTTTAHLVAKELGFDVVEFNASDTRSKKLLQEELSQLLSSKSLAGFITGGASPTRKHVLLMDEVDGMAGNEDRGGIQELISLIKNSSIPIICMCNDKNHPKMRSLVNYCYDLKFSKPRPEQIKGAMMSVCFKEGISIPPNALNEIITAAGMDIRQILTNLSVWSAGKKALNLETTTKEANAATKDVPLGQWEVCNKVFSAAEHKKMSFTDRARLFYHDYSLAPLFVQENYLKVQPHAPKNELLRRFADAAESISMGDVVDKKIRTSNNWSLLDVQAMCASVIPGGHLQGHVGAQIDFPSWLGKNSKKNKFSRLVCELQAHMRTSISASRSAVNMDYITHLRNSLAKSLIQEGGTGVSSAIDIMRSYNLLREDLDSIIELSQWPRQKDPMSLVDPKVKTAFTRTYNKTVILPYSVPVTVKKKAGHSKQDDDLDMANNLDNQEEEIDSSPEDNDDIANDAMIKAKPHKTSSKKNTESKASSNKQSTRGRKKK